MKAIRLSQKIHKWLGLIVGIQLLIWTLSGFYMVVVDIDIIHGDHLISPSQSHNLNIDGEEPSLPFAEVALRYPTATSLSLKTLMGKTVYQIKLGGKSKLLDAQTGQPYQPIDKIHAEQLAHYYYNGESKIDAISLIESKPPSEIGSRRLPLWRVDFDDIWETSFYISPNSGELITRRHALWRVFDFLWMLHIMDYDERENINNSILRVVSILGLLLVFSGVWFLYFRLNIRAWIRRRA